MNPSTALARVLVDELVRGGLREAVLSPGSRSAPLAFALHDADAEGRLRLHVRIDERSAGFLALGLAKGSGRPVALVTTSGTATANLHPAVLEASYAAVPLILLTADRPPELRGTGANQSVDQVKLYGDAVRMFAEIGTPTERAGDNAYWRSLTCRVLAAATGDAGTRPGPVQVNVGLREPLVPDEGAEWTESLEGRDDGAPWTSRVAAPAGGALPDDLPPRTVVVLGDCAHDVAAAALELAQVRGFPVVAEPSAGARTGSCLVDAAELVLGAPGFLEAHRPDRVLVVGRPTLSRAVGRLITESPCDVVGQFGCWPDTSRSAARVLPAVPVGAGDVEATWLTSWLMAGLLARGAVQDVLYFSEDLSEPVVAAAVVGASPSLLFVGSSKPVRDLFVASPGPSARVLANRGVAGIDGSVSTALGAALAHQADGGGVAYALMGDLSFLHDATGLVLGPSEPRPDLTIIVVNNDGGAIFGLLEQAGEAYTEAFERLFGTPHGVELASLCAATGTLHIPAATWEDLHAALLPAGGIRVIEVRTDRQSAVVLDRALRHAVDEALGR